MTVCSFDVKRIGRQFCVESEFVNRCFCTVAIRARQAVAFISTGTSHVLICYRKYAGKILHDPCIGRIDVTSVRIFPAIAITACVRGKNVKISDVDVMIYIALLAIIQFCFNIICSIITEFFIYAAL